MFGRFWILFLLTVIGWGSPAKATEPTQFQLVILKQDWSDLKLRYSSDEALPLLKAARAAGTLTIIGLEDIESYHWPRQSITLTTQATTRLMADLPPEGEWKSNLRAMAKIKRNYGWGNPIEWSLHQKGFLVTVNDEALYGGVFLEPMSQMAILYPVIRPGLRENKAIFNLLPVQIPFVVYDPASSQIAAWNAAIAPEGAKDWNQFPVPMKSHFINMGNRPEALAFRKLIRDTKMKEIMEKAGKLVER